MEKNTHTTNNTHMKDSGKRERFKLKGKKLAMRDTADGKPLMSLVSPFALHRLGIWCTLGAQKYEPRNWEEGMPFSRVLDSLERHIIAYKSGDRSEDHIAAIMWNGMALAHYEDMIQRGVLPAELDDLPRYITKKYVAKR